MAGGVFGATTRVGMPEVRHFEVTRATARAMDRNLFTNSLASTDSPAILVYSAAVSAALRKRSRGTGVLCSS
jgi:hypothetical protein